MGVIYGRYIGKMEKKMETTIIHYIWGYIGGYVRIMEKKMETTVVYYTWWLCTGLYRDTGKENGNNYSRLCVEVI